MPHMPLAALSAHLETEVDVLICSASFEDRCICVPEQVAKHGVGQVLLFQNRWLKGAALSNARKIRGYFGRKVTPIQFDGGNPLAFADMAQVALTRISAPESARYLVDITTFTHENLLILLSLLRETIAEGDTVTIAYSTAADYGDWLSRGFGDVRSVLGYPGRMRPSLGEHLIVLFGYETDRAERLIRTYEPAHLSVGHCEAFAAIAPELHERNVELHGRLLQLRQQVDSFQFGCDDPAVACEHILREVARRPEYNAVVAPMNTKLSTVGAAMAVFREPRIQLCYVPAREYNEEAYSTAGERCYVFKLAI